MQAGWKRDPAQLKLTSTGCPAQPAHDAASANRRIHFRQTCCSVLSSRVCEKHKCRAKTSTRSTGAEGVRYSSVGRVDCSVFLCLAWFLVLGSWQAGAPYAYGIDSGRIEQLQHLHAQFVALQGDCPRPTAYSDRTPPSCTRPHAASCRSFRVRSAETACFWALPPADRRSTGPAKQCCARQHTHCAPQTTTPPTSTPRPSFRQRFSASLELARSAHYTSPHRPACLGDPPEEPSRPPTPSSSELGHAAHERSRSSLMNNYDVRS